MIVSGILDAERRSDGRYRYQLERVLRPLLGCLLNGCMVAGYHWADWSLGPDGEFTDDSICAIPGYGHNHRCFKEDVQQCCCEAMPHGAFRYFGLHLDVHARRLTDACGEYRLPEGRLRVWHSPGWSQGSFEPRWNGRIFNPRSSESRISGAGPLKFAGPTAEVRELLRKQGLQISRTGSVEVAK